MLDSSTIGINLFDHRTGDDIEGVNFPDLLVRPLVGEVLHYWQDGTPDRAGGDSGIRRDFRVERIVHDLRYMPARNGGSQARHVHMLAIYVTEIESGEKRR